MAEQAIKELSIMTSTHSWIVYRAGELLKWIKSGEYDQILNDSSASSAYTVAPPPVKKKAKVCDVCGLNPFE